LSDGMSSIVFLISSLEKGRPRSSRSCMVGLRVAQLKSS
jgi:hypothetical protein